MKTYKLKIITLAFGAVFLSSCTSLLFTSLDVLRPAKTAFAAEATNLLLLNNTVTQPPELGHKTQLLNERTKYVLLSSDSLPIFCLAALKQELEVKDFFSSVNLLPDSKNTNTDFSVINRLEHDSVKSLCNSTQSNVILSLDQIKVNDDLSEFFIPENGSYLATLELRFETHWSINYPNSPKINTVQFKDTLYWESESYNRHKAVSDLPKRQDALIDGALYVGQHSINRFVPHWEKVDRYFFNPRNRLMRQGMDSVYVKNWKSAINYWEKAKETSHSTWIEAQAENNIAIAYEIIGDIDKALQYATLSFKSFGLLEFTNSETLNRMSEYVGDLTIRKNEIAILKKQLDEK
ncbi:MAG: DUF6340 family protein [Paludibacter sp.]